MGLFDFAKKDTKIDEAKKRLESLYAEKDKESFEEYFEKIKNLEKIPFGSLDLLEEVVTLGKSSAKPFNDYIKDASSLYKNIVLDKNNKVYENLFMKFLKLIEANIINEKIAINLNGLITDKSSLLSLIDELQKYSIDEINILIKYIQRARQYYVDDSAFLSSCLNFLSDIENKIFTDNTECLDNKIEEDMQLAGIYKNISPDQINELVNKCELSAETIEVIKTRCEETNKTLNELIDKINKIDGLSEDKKQELMKEIEGFAIAFEEKKDMVNNSITAVGEKYLEAIHKKMGVNIPGKITTSIGKIDDKPIPSFDKNISSEKRLNEIISKKQGLYHYCVDEVLKHLIINKAVYLVGPSGTGKTTMIQQIADLLGLEFYNVGFVADEFTAIKGYMDANGNFVKTPFYTAFKEGKILFFDEIDNSENKALIELNKFVSNIGYAPYLFPNGEIVNPHPNFRVIAAGNTWGDGADQTYSTREQLDGSTIHRFKRIECNYDEKLERTLFTCDDNEMFEFCMAFRKALSERDANYDFSTGDIVDVNEYLLSGIFSIEEIMCLTFITNKRAETLNQIKEKMSQLLDVNNKYYQIFSKIIKEDAHQYAKKRN